MMSACSSQNSILKGWNKSAEFNRIRFREQVLHNPHGAYSVRMDGSSKWYRCDFPPISGAAEWLFINLRGEPLFYWNKKTGSVTLIS